MTTSLTITLDAPMQAELAALDTHTRRPAESLAAKAIAAYLARERATVAAIEKARAELRAGHFVPYEEVVAGTRAIVEATRAPR